MRKGLREKIAMTIYGWSVLYSSAEDMGWSSRTSQERKGYRKRADQIIGIIVANCPAAQVSIEAQL